MHTYPSGVSCIVGETDGLFNQLTVKLSFLRSSTRS